MSTPASDVLRLIQTVVGSREIKALREEQRLLANASDETSKLDSADAHFLSRASAAQVQKPTKSDSSRLVVRMDKLSQCANHICEEAESLLRKGAARERKHEDTHGFVVRKATSSSPARTSGQKLSSGPAVPSAGMRQRSLSSSSRDVHGNEPIAQMISGLARRLRDNIVTRVASSSVTIPPPSPPSSSNYPDSIGALEAHVKKLEDDIQEERKKTALKEKIKALEESLERERQGK